MKTIKAMALTVFWLGAVVAFLAAAACWIRLRRAWVHFNVKTGKKEYQR